MTNLSDVQHALPAAQGHVLHIVGDLTEAVFGFMGPATDALARAGYQQTVVMLDQPRHRHLQGRFHKGIHLVTVPWEDRSRRHWLTLASVVRQQTAQHAFSAVHLHGFLPWALGTRMGRLLPRQTRVYYSPHGSRTLSLLRPLQTTVGALMSLAGVRQPEVIASSLSDAQRLKGLVAAAIKTAETPVDERFFEAERREARRPLLVSGDPEGNPRSVELFCRLAVLLSAAELGLSFNWFGPTDELTAARLKAANVGGYPIDEVTELASRLSAGWIFMAASEAEGFPVMLSWAMALGLPCVAADTPHHRDLIRDGATGLLYRSEEEALAQVSRLIDDPALRDKLGQAAHLLARMDQAILGAYAGGASPDPSPPRVAPTEQSPA
jgi:Glycosyl transferases group 1